MTAPEEHLEQSAEDPEEDGDCVYNNGKVACSNDRNDSYLMSGALPIPSPATGIGSEKEVEDLDDLKEEGANAARHKPRSDSVVRKVQFNDIPMVEDSDEEICNAAALYQPDRQRRQYCSGTLTTREIMRGLVPGPRYIKIHEIRELEGWLADNDYVRKSRGIGRTEKILHLLFTLQEGCRLETTAEWFARSPREIFDSCAEVFAGLHQMHSDTVVPRPGDERNYWVFHRRYRSKWNVLRRYMDSNNAIWRTHYPWAALDLLEVLLTLNLFIGRYRLQGTLRFHGRVLDWGKYVLG
ncbi:hypothetical protein BCR34DRAFT_597578 [Clohesyomyces aquaticus]|uniref:Uncharacterized protein n=1 Tax=Clohesyomyces aquaticus TaxID=1231657 RepID=A0A1Y2A274_9PLEO|nr:hypothetical protein BCR34DRAFT_597578 [Clohesyomyces aquaticus]